MWSDQVVGNERQMVPLRVVKAERAQGVLHAFPPLVASPPLAERVTQMIAAAAAALHEAPNTQADLTHSDSDQLIADAQTEALALRTAAKEEAETALLAAHMEAQSLQAVAKTESETILLVARQQAEQIQAEAQAGAADLRCAANQEATELVEKAREEAQAIVAKTKAVCAAELDALPEQVVCLSCAVAGQILRAELALRPEAILPMVQAALTRLKGEVEPLVRVAPDSLALLEAHRGRLLAAVPGARQVQLGGDPAMEPGDFQVHGALGLVDGRIDRQLSLVQEAITMKEP